VVQNAIILTDDVVRTMRKSRHRNRLIHVEGYANYTRWSQVTITWSSSRGRDGRTLLQPLALNERYSNISNSRR